MKIQEMKARLEKIVAELDVLNGLETLGDADYESINVLSDEFDKLSGQIKSAERLEQVTARATESNRKSAPVETPRVEVQATRKEKMGGFNNMGEFLVSVKKAASGDVDKRFQNNAMFEKIGEDGGFLVPEEMSQNIAKKLQSDESLLSKTSQFAVSGNSLSLPIDETAPWSGGISAYWTAEGASLTESKHKFGLAHWRLHKLAALVKTTDELLDDSTALESYIAARAPEAIMHKINSAIISGDGVGKPLGLLSSGFKVEVAAEGGQAADTILAKNVLKMYSRMLPASRSKAVWYMNAACETQLRLMKDDNDNFIYISPGSQLNQTPYGILLGRPVIPMVGSMPALGDAGDIVFADLSYYHAIVKAGGIKNSVSTHLLFDKDQTAYKFTMRLDGSVPFKTPVTTEFGAYDMSAIVTLAAR
jgi:HK97 family phage major capsid protein